MEETTATVEDTTVEIIDIQFREGQKTYYFDPDRETYAPGDHVIVDTARGAEFGICVYGNHTVPQNKIVAPLRKVLRHTTPQDERIAAENQEREKRACDVCRQKITDHNLDMQLVRAECAFDKSKILFYFTADERVDFRELVKDLAGAFHTRIELRQIGVRDKARLVGGLGICGRPLCCSEFLEDFQPVSIKMAKTQNLSLNPTKISGTCGRLMCCLKYEQDTYEALLKTVPKAESFVDTPEGRGTVINVDLLRQRVDVRMEDNPNTVSRFPVEEIAVLRNGKPKKNDPPIPADYAPISGNGRRAHQEPEADSLLLEPIRFRYSTEDVVSASKPSEDESKPRRRRKDRRAPREEAVEVAAEQKPKQQSKPAAELPTKPQPSKPVQDSPAGKNMRRRKEEKSPAEETAEPVPSGNSPADASSDRKPRRRSNYRHRRPKAPQSKPQE